MSKRNKKLAETSAEIQAPDGIEAIDLANIPSKNKAVSAIAKLFDVYQPGVVFSEPYTAGDTTVITASEVYVGMGLGFGGGSGDEAGVIGGGGGGGGGSAGRPVAAIIIGPKGVQVEPIVDVTKISIAFFTTIGAIFMAWRAMRR
jgi:uncharacterized spore protein YtfJ